MPKSLNSGQQKSESLEERVGKSFQFYNPKVDKNGEQDLNENEI